MSSLSLDNSFSCAPFSGNSSSQAELSSQSKFYPVKFRPKAEGEESIAYQRNLAGIRARRTAKVWQSRVCATTHPVEAQAINLSKIREEYRRDVVNILKPILNHAEGECFLDQARAAVDELLKKAFSALQTHKNKPTVCQQVMAELNGTMQNIRLKCAEKVKTLNK